MTKQTFPKSLAEAIKEIRKLRETAEAANKRADEANTARSHEKANRIRAEESEKQTRENFADLKERLLNAERETARLNGYLDRVREDDAVADPLVEIDGPEGKRLVSKRHPSPQILSPGNADYFRDQWNNGRPEKRKHWTSY